MHIDEIPRIRNWLSQFEPSERYIARHMLKRMRYVSFTEFESWMQRAIRELCEELASNSPVKTIVLIPIRKLSTNTFNQDKSQKASNDSAGRIGHILKNLERDLPKNVELSARPESMRARKVRHIVYVDDFIGTGDRFIKFWRNLVPRYVKSWCSLGWCQLWIVTYGAQQGGRNRIIQKIGAVRPASFKSAYVFKYSFLEKRQAIWDLLKSHADRAGTQVLAKGYGKSPCPIVFQHGCPNNAPGLFWFRPSANSSYRWQPLFPNRSIPDDLYPLFQYDFSHDITEEELWIIGRYNAAMNFIDRNKYYKGSNINLLLLNYLSIGYSMNSIRAVLVASEEELRLAISRLRESGLIDQSLSPTNFGREFLRRLGKKRYHFKWSEDSHENFYPRSFKGFQRDV